MMVSIFSSNAWQDSKKGYCISQNVKLFLTLLVSVPSLSHIHNLYTTHCDHFYVRLYEAEDCCVAKN